MFENSQPDCHESKVKGHKSWDNNTSVVHISDLETTETGFKIPDCLSNVVMVRIDEIRDVDFHLRIGGLKSACVADLARLNGNWPPIVLLPGVNSVVDGRHRLAAAKRLGHASIASVFFNGSAEDAFVRAVHLNVRQGLPLTLKERERAALRILKSHWDWSDRQIAELCALSPGTIRVLRGAGHRPSEQFAHLDARRGRDGRTRPVQPEMTRVRIREALTSNPGASLRQIAKLVNCSPETVRVVRSLSKSVEAAESETLVEAKSQADTSPDQRTRVESPAASPSPDPALTSTTDGAAFALWFDKSRVTVEQCFDFVPVVPLSRIYEISDEARKRADAWLAFARELESRSGSRRSENLIASN
jgi:DNA-binding CsgD family transcriptional regulator